MNEPSTTTPTRRAYDSPTRRRQAEQTRERIVAAGAELAHGFASWDWSELTFRAVAEHAGVGERTVYRHFPTERHLHDSVMQRLQDDAGFTYEDVDLSNLTEVTGQIFTALQRFSVGNSDASPSDPTFIGVDERRRDALTRVVSAATPNWSDGQRAAVAGLLDVLWHVPNYERLVGAWHVPAADATAGLAWLMDTVLATIADDRPPPPFA